MNRRQLFRNTLALAGASVVAPDILTEALPADAPLVFRPLLLSDIVNVDVTIVPMWPTYEQILANLTEQWVNLYGDADLSPDTQDYYTLSTMASAIHETQENCRKIVEVGGVGLWRDRPDV
jgi:hypothetical protein